MLPVRQVAFAAVEVAVFIQVNVSAFPGWGDDGATVGGPTPPVDSHEEIIVWKQDAVVGAGLAGY